MLCAIVPCGKRDHGSRVKRSCKGKLCAKVCPDTTGTGTATLAGSDSLIPLLCQPMPLCLRAQEPCTARRSQPTVLPLISRPLHLPAAHAVPELSLTTKSNRAPAPASHSGSLKSDSRQQHWWSAPPPATVARPVHHHSVLRRSGAPQPTGPWFQGTPRIPMPRNFLFSPQHDANCFLHAVNNALRMAVLTNEVARDILRRNDALLDLHSAGWFHAGDIRTVLTALSPHLSLVEGNPHLGLTHRTPWCTTMALQPGCCENADHAIITLRPRDWQTNLNANARTHTFAATRIPAQQNGPTWVVVDSLVGDAVFDLRDDRVAFAFDAEVQFVVATPPHTTDWTRGTADAKAAVDLITAGLAPHRPIPDTDRGPPATTGASSSSWAHAHSPYSLDNLATGGAASRPATATSPAPRIPRPAPRPQPHPARAPQIAEGSWHSTGVRMTGADSAPAHVTSNPLDSAVTTEQTPFGEGITTVPSRLAMSAHTCGHSVRPPADRQTTARRWYNGLPRSPRPAYMPDHPHALSINAVAAINQALGAALMTDGCALHILQGPGRAVPLGHKRCLDADDAQCIVRHAHPVRAVGADRMELYNCLTARLYGTCGLRPPLPSPDRGEHKPPGPYRTTCPSGGEDSAPHG